MSYGRSGMQGAAVSGPFHTRNAVIKPWPAPGHRCVGQASPGLGGITPAIGLSSVKVPASAALRVWHRPC
jgi:hypothetical protein